MRQGLEQVSEGQAGESQGAKVFASGRGEVRRGTALHWGPKSPQKPKHSHAQKMSYSLSTPMLTAWRVWIWETGTVSIDG